MKKVLLSLMLLVASLASFAYDFEVDGIYYNVLSKDDLTCEVTYGDNEYTGKVTIPSQVSYAGKVFDVTSIGEKAFYNCSGLTSVTIPNSVTSIRSYAFSGCRSLTSVTIPKSVTSIEKSTFYDCRSLTSVTIPNSVTSIGESAFRSCSGLTSVTIPNSVTSIRDYAFYCCSSLTSVTIPNSVTMIGSSAFYGCRSDFQTYIEIKDVESWCSNTINENLKGDRHLMLNGVEVTSITIPNSVTSIGSSAFSLCSGLTSVTIGNSVTSIGYAAFYKCSGLKEIQSLATTPPLCYSDIFYYDVFEDVSVIDCILKVPEESITAYRAANGWKDFWNIIALGSEGGGDNPGGEPEKCATPTIALQDGKIVVTTTTEGAKCSTSITSADIQSTEASEIELSGVYTITAYASKAGMWNSETATATLVWANPTIGGTGVMSMEMKKALLLHSNGNTITVDGLEEGEILELYNVNGMMLDKVTSSGTSATLGNGLQKHQIYIIKAGDRSIKYKF